ncbi:MAG: hypothetical protein ABS36_04740 [Acidobacteria bacterium SCN 69-37]|nr:MAG: hypothetical protein ABS36_04740 [Acidobacteria bacterium SCN 69-37]
MSLAHFTLPTRSVEATAALLDAIFGYPRLTIPGNSPIDTQWFDIGGGQQLHVVYVEHFTVSPFEGEFGRHLALFHPLREFDAMKARLAAHGAEIFHARRPTPFERFFFREPINGYVFEVIDAARMTMPAEP